MPAPTAVVVVAVIAGVGAVIAFKEFVYEPHIAPALERWAQNFLDKRRAKRGAQVSVPVPSVTGPSTRRGRSDDGNDHDGASAYELEGLAENEVDDWRRNVNSTQAGLRLRRTVVSDAERYSFTSNSLDESITTLPYTPIVPTHVISNDSSPTTPPVPDIARDLSIPAVEEDDSTPWDLHIGSSSLSRSMASLNDRRTSSSRTAGHSSRTATLRSPLSQTPVIPTPSSTSAIFTHNHNQHNITNNNSYDNPFASPFDVDSATPAQEFSPPHILFSSSPPSNIRSLSERYPTAMSPPIEITSPVSSPVELLSPASRTGSPPVDVVMRDEDGLLSPMSLGLAGTSSTRAGTPFEPLVLSPGAPDVPPSSHALGSGHSSSHTGTTTFLSPAMSASEFMSADEWDIGSNVSSPLRGASPIVVGRADGSLLLNDHVRSDDYDDDDGDTDSESDVSDISSWASVPRRR